MPDFSRLRRFIVRHPMSLKIRNTLGIRPSRAPTARHGGLMHGGIPSKTGSYSSSDLFIWRAGTEFKTIIRISDLLKNYFQANSELLVVLYDSAGTYVNKREYAFTNNVIELKFDESLVGDQEKVGTFSVFHVPAGPVSEVKIRNRCYVGYSFRGSLPSFSHGNLIGQYMDIGEENHEIKNDIFFSSADPVTYKVQKDFSEFDRSELIFSNPTQYRVWVEVNQTRQYLSPRSPAIFEVGSPEIVEVKSNFSYPRPIVMSYRGNFFDVHHG